MPHNALAGLGRDRSRPEKGNYQANGRVTTGGAAAAAASPALVQPGLGLRWASSWGGGSLPEAGP